MKRLYAFATRWGSEFGGINSFNTDLLRATAAAFDRKIRLCCIIPNATDGQVEAAKLANVELLRLGCTDTEFVSSAVVCAVLQNAGLAVDEETVWLGHDRITGRLAVDARAAFGGRSAVIHHMSYAHYEAYAESSLTCSAKVEEQRQIFSGADTVFAVGPLLLNSISDIATLKDQALMLMPGLPEIPVSQAPNAFSAYLSGRVSADASRIKQAHLGVAGFAHSVWLAHKNPGLPDPLQPKSEPRLLIRGIDEEQIPTSALSQAEKDLRVFAEEYAHRALNIVALPFTQDREQIFRELSRSTMALMPSWHEGFGLVGWEAIGAGVPLVVSQKSGLYKFLQAHDGGVYGSLVVPIDVKGKSEWPYFREEDYAEVADAIIRIAKDPREARRRAARLREGLSKFTWANCATDLVSGLGWELKKGSLGDLLPSFSRPPTEIGIGTTSQDPCILFPERMWTPDKGLSESHLLRPEEAFVPFDVAREPFLAELQDWALNTKYATALRLITGAGALARRALRESCAPAF